MLLFIINIVAPVFLFLIAGYLSVKTRLTSDMVIDGVMRFASVVAVPCLLFHATLTIDLNTAYDWRVLVAYYASAISCFLLAIISTQKLFNRRPGEAVAVGFSTLYFNLVLLGVPITERAFGEEGMLLAITLISIHGVVGYFIGILVMEGVRADGRTFAQTLIVAFGAMFKNPFMIGLILGFAVNIAGLQLPQMLLDFINMLKQAALPCALFGLGGILVRYKLNNNLKEAGYLSAIGLLLHPILAFLFCVLVGLDSLGRNVVVLMAAMPAGVNAYLFAQLYSRGVGTAANTVLLGTALSVLTISAWLYILMT